MSADAKSVQAMIDRMRDIVSGHGPRPIPGMLHVGSERALEIIASAAGWRSTHAHAPLDALYGVRIVVGSLNTALPLDEMGWRLLDSQGEIISEGVITEP